MGGSGSGNWYRWDKKNVVEDHWQLDTNRWTQEGVLRQGLRRSGLWQWTCNGEVASSLGYEVNTLDLMHSWVRLFYTITRTGEKMDYSIRLVTTRPYFGGLRWWFVCPLIVNGVACGRRVAKLYMGGRYYGCRHCNDLTYQSCQDSHKFDGVMAQMAAAAGMDAATAKRLLFRKGNER